MLVACGGSSTSTSTGTPAPTGTGTTPTSGGGTPSPTPSPGTTTSGVSHAFVLNGSGTTITQFNVAGNGALIANGSTPYVPERYGTGMTRTGNVLWVASGLGPAQITSYQIGSDGKLTMLVSTTTPQTGHYGLYAHPSENFLYESTNFGLILGYRIGSGGSLTPIDGTPLNVGPTETMELSPDGKFLFVVLLTANGPMIGAYQISSSGTLSQVSGSPFPTNAAQASGIGKSFQSMHIIVDPGSHFLFACDGQDQTVRTFAIGSSGSLSPVGTPVSTATSTPYSMATDPAGKILYVGSFAGTDLTSFSIAGNGQLAQIAKTQNVMTPAYWMTVSPGGILYVANNDPGSISVWNSNAGVLTQVSGSPFITSDMTGNNPSYIVLSP